MSIFDNLDNVVPRNANYEKLPEGDFLLELDSCLTKKSEQFNDDMFIAEFVVHEASVPGVKAGDKVSWNQKCKDPKVFLPALSGFICSTLGYDKNKDAETIKKEIAPNLRKFGEAFVNPGIARGYLVRCNVRHIKTKGNRDFMLHTFTPALTPKEQSARLKK